MAISDTVELAVPFVAAISAVVSALLSRTWLGKKAKDLAKEETVTIQFKDGTRVVIDGAADSTEKMARYLLTMKDDTVIVKSLPKLQEFTSEEQK